MSLLTFVEPLQANALAGLTPAKLLVAQRDPANWFWLDSAAGEPRRRSWSYLGRDPLIRIEIHKKHVTTYQHGKSESVPSDAPWHYLFKTLNAYRSRKVRTVAGPPFCGGWVGYLGYECIGPQRPGAVLPPHGGEGCAPPDLSFPESSFGLFDTVLAFSHADQCWWAAVTLPAEAGQANCEREALLKVQHLVKQIAHVQPSHLGIGHCPSPRCAVSATTRQGYCAAVGRALDYIAAGDIYQVNLAQRFTVPWALPPEALYWRLRQQSPAEYGAFLGSALVGNGQTLCSISPELFLRLRRGEVETRPIKGTRPRGWAGGPDDATARRELEASAKERAELNMIVDLERNDLGRVCEYGSVRVVTPGQIEELPTVFHRVATVTGRLRGCCGAVDLLQAAFPGGSVTGAPKIRAMEIIAELEPVRRGPYCGAIGWLGLDGDMDLSIAIRTALCDGPRGLAHYHAGSGIVADSGPEQEFEETLHKTAAFFQATNAAWNRR
ncbi:MAG: anthranilate synthase component I family protein [Planctomycetota bacterium]